MTQANANHEVEANEDEEPEFDGICAVYGEHRGERTTYEDEDGIQWECTECGAEGWEDK